MPCRIPGTMSRRSLLRGLTLLRPNSNQLPTCRFLTRPSSFTLAPQTCRLLSMNPTHQTSEIRSIAELPNRINPRYLQSTKPGSSLLSLNWPKPPRNLLIIHKLYSDAVVEAVVKFPNFLHN